MTIKLKSSYVLAKAKELIETKQCDFVCCAIIAVETEHRWANNGENVVSKAQKHFDKYMPPDIDKRMQSTMPWWNKGDPLRLEVLTQSIKDAIKQGD